MDNLLENLTDTLSLTENSVYAEHPRWSNYKNEGKASESQRSRRQTHLQKQKDARQECLDRIRGLCDEDNQDENYVDPHDASLQIGCPSYDQMEIICENPAVTHHTKRGKKRPLTEFTGYLMLSEWLIDIPDRLSEEWTMLPCPEGKRCLVVARNGSTMAFAKNWRILANLQSSLPGGSYTNCRTTTMLDAIMLKTPPKTDRKFYALDLLCWKSCSMVDSDFMCRRFFLRSKLDECAEERMPCPFNSLPSCPCSQKDMSQLMRKEFPFSLDGLLFYHNEATYSSGQTPLVGWLKPWMLPEMLGVAVPEKYTMNHPPPPSNGGKIKESPSLQFIEKFNRENRIVSHINKQTDTTDQTEKTRVPDEEQDVKNANIRD